MMLKLVHVRYDFHNLFIVFQLASLLGMFIFAAFMCPLNLFDLNSDQGFLIEYWIGESIYGLLFGVAFLGLERIVCN